MLLFTQASLSHHKKCFECAIFFTQMNILQYQKRSNIFFLIFKSCKSTTINQIAPKVETFSSPRSSFTCVSGCNYVFHLNFPFVSMWPLHSVFSIPLNCGTCANTPGSSYYLPSVNLNTVRAKSLHRSVNHFSGPVRGTVNVKIRLSWSL